MYDEPSTPDAAVEYLKKFREQALERHLKRMEEWKIFGSPEYKQAITEELLKNTTADTMPPWLVDVTKGEEVPDVEEVPKIT